MGAVAPLSFGPISDPSGTLMHDLLDVDKASVIKQITSLRIGHSANIELFQYEAPDQRKTHPRNSDWSGHHIAFYVTDIAAAVAYMEAKGVQKFLGPFPLTAGPAAGQSINSPSSSCACPSPGLSVMKSGIGLAKRQARPRGYGSIPVPGAE